MLRVLGAIFWFLLFALFACWVLFWLPPREHRHDDDPGELPLRTA